MPIEKFIPKSPDRFIRNSQDFEVARFGHLNEVISCINAAGSGGISYFTTNCNTVCGRTESILLASGTLTNIDAVISAKNAGRIQFGTNGNINTCADFIDTNLSQTVLGGSIICSIYTGTGRSTAIGWSNVLKEGNCNVVFGFRNTVCSTFDSRRFNGIFGTDNILNAVGERNHMYGYANTLCGTINSHTFGNQNIGTGSTYSSLIGCGNTTSVNNSINIGSNNNLSGACSHILGRFNTASGIGATVLGHSNIGSGTFSSILGGQSNQAIGTFSSVVGGQSNCALASHSFVGGGINNMSNAACSAIGGGIANKVSGARGFVGAGSDNTVSGGYSGILGGCGNLASGGYSSILVGKANTASGTYSNILGGRNNNTNSFNDTFIAGSNITANAACTTFVNKLAIMTIPTSSAGLPSGSVWSNSGVLNIVP